MVELFWILILVVAVRLSVFVKMLPGHQEQILLCVYINEPKTWGKKRKKTVRRLIWLTSGLCWGKVKEKLTYIHIKLN